MKKKTLAVVAMSMAIAIAGAGTLNIIVKANQEEEIVQTVDEGQMVQTDEEKTDINSESSKGKITIDDLNLNGFERKAADMDVQDAVEIVLHQIEKEYGEVKVSKVTEMGLYEPAIEDYSFRAYIGTVLCEDGYGYEFTIDTITGKMYSLMQVSDKYSEVKEHGEDIQAMLKKDKNKYEQYEQAAISFAEDAFGEKVTVAEINEGSTARDVAGYHFERVAVVANCYFSNGDMYSIWMDPDTSQVFCWDIMEVSVMAE